MEKAKSSKEFRGALALFSLATIYGFIGYFSRELAPGLSLLQQLYIRLVLAAPLLWLTFHKHINLRNCVALVKKEPWLILLRTACLYMTAIPLYFYAVQHATLSNVAFLSILPYTFVLGAIVNKEKLTRTKVILMLMALFGAALITIKGGLNLSSFGKGELAAIASGALLSLGLVTRKRHKAKVNDFELSLVLITLAAVLALLLSVVKGDGFPHTAVSPQRFWILLLTAAYINSFLILFANFGFKYVRDTLANNIMALEGVFGLIFGLLIYHEVPQSREVIGASIIFVSAIMSAYLTREQSRE